jgi:hypothetical protein
MPQKPLSINTDYRLTITPTSLLGQTIKTVCLQPTGLEAITILHRDQGTDAVDSERRGESKSPGHSQAYPQLNGETIEFFRLNPVIL